MKKQFLIFFVANLLFSFCVQASLRKLPYQGKLKPEAVAVNWQGIWAVAGQKREDNNNSDFYLVKWNSRKNDWVKQVLVAKDIFDFRTEGKVIASRDGVILILSPIKRTLYKFANKKLEKIYEFGLKNVNQIAATDIESLFYTEIQQACPTESKQGCSFFTVIKKWNPTKKEWDNYGKPLPGLWEKASVSVDGLGYVGGTEWTIKKDGTSVKKSKVFYWNNRDFRWESTDIPFNSNVVINEIAAARNNDIWFHLIGSASKIEIFHWDGKKLKKRIENEALTFDSMLIDLAAIPGTVVGVDLGGNVYIYKYRKHKVGINPVKIRPPFRARPTIQKKVGEKTISPSSMPEEIRKVYDQAPKNSEDGVLAAPPPFLN